MANKEFGKEFSAILIAVKRASVFDLAFISFLLLPFALAAWFDVIEKVDELKRWRPLLLGILVFAYVVVISLLYVGSRNEKQRELAKDKILGYLQGKSFEMMSFERVREKINSSYTDAFLQSVINAYPTHLRPAKLKGGGVGVARLMDIKEKGDENEG